MQTHDSAVFQGKHTQIKVEITGSVPGSRTLFEVTETDRGPGWNEQLQKYTGTTRQTLNPKTGEIISQSWARGENKGYGRIFQAHKNQLTPLA